MLQRNMGRLDRTVRFLVGVALIPIGLFALRGAEGNLAGIVVAVFAVMPMLTGLTGFCPAYVPFGISTGGPGDQPTAARGSRLDHHRSWREYDDGRTRA